LQGYRARPECLRELGKQHGPANPRVLIIDDSEDFRLLASHYVLGEWPGAEIEEWDPVARGKPAHDFAWGRYDVLLLDYKLSTEDGLAWLGEFRRDAKCPPVIFLTGAGNESLAARAIKEGAAEYLSKLELTKARLVEAIAAAISERTDNARTLRLDLPAPRPAETGGGAKPLSGYQIVRKIGQGGMADVYLAIRARDGLPVVLKMLSPKLREDERHVTRFARESGFISKMGGPYLATIYDQSVTPDCAYIAMEYFSGGDLQQRIGPSLSRGQAVRYLVEIAWALDYVHGSDVIHRDLKPQNVMLREDGSIALVDFGISKAVADEAGLTKHGELVGTPRYMSPECCQGAKVDHRHDLYSLGVIFYEMLSVGKPLY
jgi:CheY-like chemotaxis protein/tRNA A-37 threonylcarbamoyl transferase component Bud32